MPAHAGRVGAAEASARSTIAMQKLPAPAPVMSQIPQSFKSTCDAAAKSHNFTAATRLDWCTAFGTVQTVLMDEEPIGTATVDQVDLFFRIAAEHHGTASVEGLAKVRSVIVGDVVHMVPDYGTEFDPAVKLPKPERIVIASPLYVKSISRN